MEAVRIDTYLWAIRMFKSRSIASTAIKSGKVTCSDVSIKPSHIVKKGENYRIKIGEFTRIIEVAEIINKRQSYEKVKHCYIEHTPKAEKKEKLEDMFFRLNVFSKKGSGRPTKKDRRNLGKTGGWFED